MKKSLQSYYKTLIANDADMFKPILSHPGKRSVNLWDEHFQDLAKGGKGLIR